MEPIRVFEYEKLHIGGQFTEDHLDSLAKYNEEHGGAYFKIGYKSVQFQQYVGVIQVGNLTIEILPKVGKTASSQEDEEKAKWQKILLDMLQQCNWMTVHANEKAPLQFKHNSILEAYLELFVRECEYLLQLGLIKKYRQNEGNKNSLKGKFIFSKNIQHNIIHQERFYTRHQVYDKNNIYNQILFMALNTIPRITSNPLLNDRLYSLLFSFPELDNIHVTPATFSNLVFDRKTSAYEEAISMAAMILLNCRPDIQNGQNNVLAILFDMNDLWEEYVYRQLLRFCQPPMQIIPQEYKKVWERESNSSASKGIKPDIILETANKTLIIDTKWKLPEDDIPSDADLKQMFMYNEYWDKANAILFYPKDFGEITIDPGIFIAEAVLLVENNTRHKCGVLKASVLSNDASDNEPILDLEFGGRIFEKLEEIELI